MYPEHIQCQCRRVGRTSRVWCNDVSTHVEFIHGYVYHSMCTTYDDLSYVGCEYKYSRSMARAAIVCVIHRVSHVMAIQLEMQYVTTRICA